MQATRGTPITAGSAKLAGRNRLRWLFALVAVGGLATDVVTKAIVVSSLDPASPVRLLGGALTLRLIRNPGAAFSVGEHFTFVFALLSVAVLTFVVAKLVPRIGHPGWAVALGLLAAGVAGNLTDRLFRRPGVLRGHVVDFFQLPHFAIFNFADMCITGAAVMIMILAVIKNVAISGEHYARVRPEHKSELKSDDG